MEKFDSLVFNYPLTKWRHDIQHIDTQHNGIQHNDTQHNSTQCHYAECHMAIETECNEN
jgi:hypothetical protein